MNSGHRCEHGVDDRIGVCADCTLNDPDAPAPTYSAYAPVRPPYEPSGTVLAIAGRQSAGVGTEDGDTVATVTVRLRRNAAPDVTCTGPLTAADAQQLRHVQMALWDATRKLTPLEWFDPARVQGFVDAEHESAAKVAAYFAEERTAAEAAKPWLCRWCQTGRYKTDRGRKSHERVCMFNPDRWFRDEPGAMIPTFSAGGKCTGWVQTSAASTEELAAAHAERFRKKRAALFDQPQRRSGHDHRR